MEVPALSIVMPAYNISSYISEAIESTLDQTFSDFEFIIVDDGSTDDTNKIIRGYKDERINLIVNKHDYIGSLNLGMSTAKGKYIVRMDADDIMMPNRLQKQFDFMENNLSVDISGCLMQGFGERSDIIRNAIHYNDLLLITLFQPPLYHPTVIMRKNIISDFPEVNGVYQVYDPDYIYAEDYKLWIELIKKGYKMENMPDVLVKHRYGNSQITRKRIIEAKECALKIQNEYVEYVMDLIVEKDDEYYDLFNQLIELCNNNKISFNSLKQVLRTVYLEIMLT